MAPLSRELAGLILTHNKFGDHLDKSSKTIDESLEIKNFEYAGQTLAEVWSRVVIDGYPVFAEFASQDCVAEEPEAVLSAWYDVHVKESQYFLQVKINY